MGFTKHIPPDIKDICTHPEHNPPSHIVLEPGTHYYECPSCQKETILVINPILYGDSKIVS